MMDTQKIQELAGNLSKQRSRLRDLMIQRKAINSEGFNSAKIEVSGIDGWGATRKWCAQLSDQFGENRRGSDMLRLAMLKITDERITQAEIAIEKTENEIRSAAGEDHEN